MNTTFLEETKLPTYWNTSFSKICLGMNIVSTDYGIKIGAENNFVVINKQATSLFSLIADEQHRNTSLGRNRWIDADWFNGFSATQL